MSVYSLHSPNLITKFDASGNPEATYETTPTTCTCPAGQRPTCRHRQMLPMLEPIKDSHWFLVYEPQGNILHGTVVDFNGTPKHLLDRLTLNETDNVDWDRLAEERLGQRPREALPEGPEIAMDAPQAALDIINNPNSWEDPPAEFYQFTPNAQVPEARRADHARLYPATPAPQPFVRRL